MLSRSPSAACIGHLFLCVPVLFYLFVHKLSVSISAFVFFARFLTCFSFARHPRISCFLLFFFFLLFYSLGFVITFDGLHAENAEKRAKFKIINHTQILFGSGEQENKFMLAVNKSNNKSINTYKTKTGINSNDL